MSSVLSVNTGRIAPFETPKKVGRSAIVKTPVEGIVAVRGDLVGDDQQADKAVHGGPDQAVYAYARESYEWWEAELGHPLENGTFGENLTTEGIDVDDALIGERWKIGSTILEVTAPRIPCSTLASRMGDTKFVKTFAAGRRPGAYFRIIEPGELESGDEIEVISRPDHEVTIRLVNEARLHDKSLLKSLAPAVDQLSKDFRELVLAAS